MRKYSISILTFLIAAHGIAVPARLAIPEQPIPGKPIVLPTRYDEHRFYVQPVTKNGVKLNLFTDTGGGLFLFDDVVERLHLQIEKRKDRPPQYPPTVKFPAFNPRFAIPSPLGNEDRLFVFPRKGNAELDQSADLMRDWSGMLGTGWFSGRVWTFDYLGRRLLWRAPGDLPSHDPSHQVKLAFQTDHSGKRTLDFPRIQISVDGETLDMLFDTGATNILSDSALALIHDGRPANRATSFISTTVYERWHNKHPDWRAYENIKSLSGSAMIEVPQVTVGGYTVGPVWFTRQPDHAFHTYMASMMDRPVEGALGGSALHYFRVTVDYPNAVAVFERPAGQNR